MLKIASSYAACASKRVTVYVIPHPCNILQQEIYTKRRSGPANYTPAILHDENKMVLSTYEIDAEKEKDVAINWHGGLFLGEGPTSAGRPSCIAEVRDRDDRYTTLRTNDTRYSH